MPVRPVLLALVLAHVLPALPCSVAATTGDARAAARAALVVRVSDQRGRAVGNATVLVARVGDDRPALAVTAAEPGRYAHPDLEPGLWVLTVQHDGHAIVSRELRLDAEAQREVEVRLAANTFEEAVTVDAGPRRDDTVTRLPDTLHETPRSVSVIDSRRIREQNFRGVNDALAYVPGMSVNSYRAGGYHFYSRGYRMQPDDTRVDGFAGINAGGGFGASLFGVEQAVMLRGPAGLLYGSAGSPGGLINLVTKKPLDQRQATVDVRMGTYAGNGVGFGERGTMGTDIDVTGPLTRDHRVLYRALGTFEHAAYFTQGVDDRNRFLNGSLTIRLDQAGRYALTPLVQSMRAIRPAGGGIVISPSTSLATNDGRTGPINLADLTPLDVNFSSGGRTDETLMTGLDLRARPDDRVAINAAYRYIGFDTDIDQFAPQVNVSQLVNAGTVSRVHTRSRTERRTQGADVNGSYEFRGARRWKSLLQVGAQARWADTRATTPSGPVPGPQSPVDIYTGVATPLVANYPSLTMGAWSLNQYWNTYLQNRTSLADGRWVATVGLGYGENRIGNGPARRSDAMPNAALVFNATSQLALYGSYATSFNPTDPAVENATGQRNAFAPTTGRNAEVGAKYDLADQRASLTLAVFHNEVSNGLVQSGPADLNPNGNRYFVEAGTRRSRGVETSADVRATRDLQLLGSVTWLDAIYTGEGPASAVGTLAIPGSRAEKSPRWAASAWARYLRSEGRLSGLGAGLGVVWQATRFGGNGAMTPAAPDPLLLPAFTRVDASLTYRLSEQIDLGVNCENLTDQRIFVSGIVGSSLEIAAPRTLMFRIGYRMR